MFISPALGANGRGGAADSSSAPSSPGATCRSRQLIASSFPGPVFDVDAVSSVCVYI